MLKGRFPHPPPDIATTIINDRAPRGVYESARRDRPLTPAAASHTVEKTSVMRRRSTQTATFCYFRESTPS
jgi:hypothetical protein